MIAVEPHLRKEDLRLWDGWRRAFLLHARTLSHRRAIDDAKRVVDAAVEVAPGACSMWSGGKDSTVMLHLLRVGMGVDLPVLSEKDDLDFPGEREYVERLALAWNARLTVITPPISPAQWIADHAGDLELGGDIHGRAAGLSKACFYDVVEEAGRPFDGIFLGLRKAESTARRLDWYTHAATIDGEVIRGLYQRQAGADRGKWRACPLGTWSGHDVYAYAETHGIEVLPLYRCIALMHAREPWLIRKSWWLPGANSRHGGVAWLNHYFPSLFERLKRWMPRVQALR